MDIDWLFKPVSHLVSKIQATQSRHLTRSSIDDARAGRIIYRHASYLPASNFVSLSMDDVELIDLVREDETKKIWHCADINKSIMLQKALTVAWNEANGEKEKSTLPELFVQNQIRNIKNETPHKLQFLGIVSLFTAKSSDRVIAFKLHSFVVYDYDEKESITNIQAIITEANLYGSSAPERLMQILQLVQGQMVESHRIQVIATKRQLPAQSLLAFQYLGFETSSSSNSKDEEEVILTRIDVLKLTKSTYRMLWGKLGFSIKFPGVVTDDKIYNPIQKFTNKIVSDMLLRKIDEEPSFGVSIDIDHWINGPIEDLLKKNKDIEDIHVIFQFAIDVAASATHIPLPALTHGIAMRLKARSKKTAEDTSHVMFETTLELIQDISVIIRKASPVHTQYVGDCHECQLFCYKCYTPFGIKGTIFQVLYEAPYAIVYHHGLELPENGLNDSSNDRFVASLPIHTMPDNHPTGIEVTKRQTKYERCEIGNGHDLDDNPEILANRLNLHNLSEAMRIDSAFTGDTKFRHYNTTAMLFSLFDVMFHR
jgi:hypothetical protein